VLARIVKCAVARPLRLCLARRGVGAAQFNQRNAATPHIAPSTVPTSQEDVMQLVKSFIRNEEGQDLLEYALLVALIALVAVAAVTAAGGSVKTIFEKIAAAIGGAAA
jgi:pilus assembly protein Flp/PilA